MKMMNTTMNNKVQENKMINREILRGKFRQGKIITTDQGSEMHLLLKEQGRKVVVTNKVDVRNGNKIITESTLALREVEGDRDLTFEVMGREILPFTSQALSTILQYCNLVGDDRVYVL